MKKPVALIILDGWGISNSNSLGNAIKSCKDSQYLIDLHNVSMLHTTC